MTLLTAFVGEVGIAITMSAEYLQDGPSVFFTRIDKLGDYIESSLAIVFNLTLLSASSCMLLAMYGLFSLKAGANSHLIAICGFLVALSTLLVGIFPPNYVLLHKLASLSFLFSLIALYGLSIIGRIQRFTLCSTPMFLLSLVGLTACLTILSQYNWSILDLNPCRHYRQMCWTAIAIAIQVQVIILWCVSLAITIGNQLRHPLLTISE